MIELLAELGLEASSVVGDHASAFNNDASVLVLCAVVVVLMLWEDVEIEDVLVAEEICASILALLVGEEGWWNPGMTMPDKPDIPGIPGMTGIAW